MSFITYRKVRMMSDQEKVLFILSGAPIDPPASDPEFQRELRAFSAALREAGIVYSQRAMAFDGAGALGYPLGEYFISLAQVVGPVVGVALGAWITARGGRKLRIKAGNVELEANSKEDIEHLQKLALELIAAQPKEAPKA
jgi:hypothetical protein